jgi:hypothetical protein
VQPLGYGADDLPVDIRNLLAQPRNFRFAHTHPPTTMDSPSADMASGQWTSRIKKAF